MLRNEGPKLRGASCPSGSRGEVLYKKRSAAKNSRFFIIINRQLPLVGKLQLKNFCKNPKICDCSKIAQDLFTFSKKKWTPAIRSISFRIIAECDTSKLLTNSQAQHTPLHIMGNFSKRVIFHFTHFLRVFLNFSLISLWQPRGLRLSPPLQGCCLAHPLTNEWYPTFCFCCALEISLKEFCKFPEIREKSKFLSFFFVFLRMQRGPARARLHEHTLPKACQKHPRPLPLRLILGF